MVNLDRQRLNDDPKNTDVWAPRFGADIVPFEGEFDADGISAGEIIDDLLDHASR